MTTSTRPPVDRIVRGWIGFLAIAAVASWLFGPLAAGAVLLAAGVALIVTGIRTEGWPRPILIAVGLLVLALPVLLWLDAAGGTWTVIGR